MWNLIIKLKIICTLCLLIISSYAFAEITLPDNPTESIRYWQEYVIDPKSNKSVALSQQVYEQLLLAWDTSRIKPKVYVVRAQVQPWAASLSDGSILVSLPAVDLALKDGPETGRHLLAFILAHELAHQRNNDMWHTKFLRLAASLNTSPQAESLSLAKRSENEDIRITEEKEVRADREALAMMAIVGFDPKTVVRNNDFFTTWVETLRGQSCQSQNKSEETTFFCAQAQARSLRAKARIIEQANQSVLFTIGKQLFVAGAYAQARELFQTFGYEFPFQAVFSNIGLSYVSEAVKIDQHLREHSVVTDLLPVFPLILQSLKYEPINQQSAKFRSAENNVTPLSPKEIRQLRKKYSQLMEEGIKAFEQALSINEESPQNVRFIISAHISLGNYLTAKAYLHERYARQFGEDLWWEFFNAQLFLLDGDLDVAKTQMEKLLKRLEKNDDKNQKNLLSVVYQAYISILKSQNATDEIAHFIKIENRLKDPYKRFAFLSVVAELNPQSMAARLSSLTSNQITKWKENKLPLMSTESQAIIWLSGEPLTLHETQQNIQVLKTKTNKIAALWEKPSITPSDFLQELIKAFKHNQFGLASRVIQHQAGYYLAYDSYGLALNIEANQLVSWFSYPSLDHSKLKSE